MSILALKARTTDLYQLTMLYGYWLAGRHEEEASFDLFFRKHPFGGEFTFFAGLEDVLNYLEGFGFDDADIAYYKTIMPHWKPDFFIWLRQLNCKHLKLDAMTEGKLVFPGVPLCRVSGHLSIAQYVETALLYQINFPSLITTQAARMRLAAGFEKQCLEFGLRRAQDGLRAAKYAYMGGFDGTSNTEAGMEFDIPVRGTHAHSWVMSFKNLHDLATFKLTDSSGVERDFVAEVLKFREQYNGQNTNEGELAAFIQYAMAFPNSFLALVDTYDTLKSGVPNFMFVAMALFEFGYAAKGVRIDSGDLAYLSVQIRKMFDKYPTLYHCIIVASNDLDEAMLHSLNAQDHAIDAYGIGTALVTCADQPALGGVYKLGEINDEPRMKFSQNPVKNTIPGIKRPLRLYGRDYNAVLDLMIAGDEELPQPGERVHCRHPFDQTKHVIVVPKEVEELHHRAWDGERTSPARTLNERRDLVLTQLKEMPAEMTRVENPRAYKVAVSEQLFRQIQELRDREVPIEVLT